MSGWQQCRVVMWQRTRAKELYPVAETADNVIATGLANVNMVLHPPGAILGAAWVETCKGDFNVLCARTAGMAWGAIMAALDGERLAVAKAYGHKLPDSVY